MNIYQRFNAVREVVREVAKRQTHKHHRYQFAGHDDVTASVRTAMVEQGIDHSVSVIESNLLPDGRVQVQVEIVWTNCDEPSEQKRVLALGEGPPPDKGGKGAPQHIGSAISYAVKFALLKNFMLVGDDTPDVENYSDQGSYEPAPARRSLANTEVDQLEAALSNAVDIKALEKAAALVTSRRNELDQSTLDKFIQLYNSKYEEFTDDIPVGE